jgi:heme-degrading monooxygenase HmoA
MPNRTPKIRNVIVNLIPTENQALFVLIVLTVRPENQQALIDTIRSAGDPAKVPGLHSINLLRSLDGTQVINHMHWASKEAYEEARTHLPMIKNTRAGVQRLIENAATNIYEVVSLS